MCTRPWSLRIQIKFGSQSLKANPPPCTPHCSPQATLKAAYAVSADIKASNSPIVHLVSFFQPSTACQGRGTEACVLCVCVAQAAARAMHIPRVVLAAHGGCCPLLAHVMHRSRPPTHTLAHFAH